MISFLSGKIIIKRINFVVIEVQGVGYKVYIGLNLLDKIGPVGQKIALYIHQSVRENALELFGFLEHDELEFFENLISVSGVGPRVAQNIISNCSIIALRDAIINSNPSVFISIPRIGTKLAQKIIIELGSKIADVSLEHLEMNDEILEIISALKELGYSRTEINKAVNDLPKGVEGTEQRLRWVLKKMGNKKN